jgi:hypothetical protein
VHFGTPGDGIPGCLSRHSTSGSLDAALPWQNRIQIAQLTKIENRILSSRSVDAARQCVSMLMLPQAPILRRENLRLRPRLHIKYLHENI